MNRRRVGRKEDVCLPECADVCYILPVTSLVNNIILSWPVTVKSSLHSKSTCNIPLIQNDPGCSISFFTVRAGLLPDSRGDIKCNPSCARGSFDITPQFLHSSFPAL